MAVAWVFSWPAASHSHLSWDCSGPTGSNSEGHPRERDGRGNHLVYSLACNICDMLTYNLVSSLSLQHFFHLVLYIIIIHVLYRGYPTRISHLASEHICFAGVASGSLSPPQTGLWSVVGAPPGPPLLPCTATHTPHTHTVHSKAVAQTTLY